MAVRLVSRLSSQNGVGFTYNRLILRTAAGDESHDKTGVRVRFNWLRQACRKLLRQLFAINQSQLGQTEQQRGQVHLILIFEVALVAWPVFREAWGWPSAKKVSGTISDGFLASRMTVSLGSRWSSRERRWVILLDMARLPRFDLAGVPQHVVQRGNNRLPCFLDDEDRQRYLQCLRQVLLRCGCRLHAYVLMSNHAHLLLTPDEAGGVSRLMHTFAQLRRLVQWSAQAYGNAVGRSLQGLPRGFGALLSDL
jgi:REP element-mobilizing transposase RayT